MLEYKKDIVRKRLFVLNGTVRLLANRLALIGSPILCITLRSSKLFNAFCRSKAVSLYQTRTFKTKCKEMYIIPQQKITIRNCKTINDL